MIRKHFFPALGLALAILPQGAQAKEYDIDGAHTKLTFKVRHLGISWVPGTFTKLSGQFNFEEGKVENSKASAKIEVGSIDTSNQKRDDHLRSDDFFAAAKFPEITFTSTKVIPGKENKFEVVGDLAMHGVTKSVVLDAEFTGAAKDPYGNDRVAFSATTKLNRKDFGLQWNKVLETGALVVGDEVLITLDVEGIQKKSE